MELSRTIDSEKPQGQGRRLCPCWCPSTSMLYSYNYHPTIQVQKVGDPRVRYVQYLLSSPFWQA